MTYQEIQDRLSKCEKTLKDLKAGNYSNLSTKKTKLQVEKLTILRESLQKQLKEANGTVNTADPDQAEKLADKGVNVNLVDKDELETNEGGFDQNETAKIAASVGKAAVLALNDMGENISKARVINIKPDTFDIRITFANDSEEVYQFYISENDRLMLKQPSYDRDLADVGESPSGAVINIDVVKDAFGKELKSIMSETMTDKEFQDAKEAERLEKHPERDKIKKIQALINKERRLKNTKESLVEREYAADKYNVNVHGYQTKYYKICPGAKAFMQDVVDGEYGDLNKEEVIRIGKLHDLLFMHEIKALKDSAYAAKILNTAEYIVETIKDQVQSMGINVKNVDYLDGHIEKIKDAAEGIKEGEGDDHHYIKVPRSQYKKAQRVIDDVLRNDVYGGHKHDIVDNDGRGNVIFYFMGPEEKAITYDAVVYLRNSDVDVVDSSVEDIEEGDGMTTKIKLSDGDPTNMAYTKKVKEAELSKAEKGQVKKIVKQLKKSVKGHGAQAKYLDTLVKEVRGDMDTIKDIIRTRANQTGFEEREEAAEIIAALALDYKLSLKTIQNYMDSDEPVNPFSVNEDDLVSITDGQYAYIKGIIDILKSGEMPKDIEYRKEAIKALASLLRNPSSIKEDMDVGHQDDEPSMLKSTAYESASYAAKLYKKLAKYDQFDGEVDFPNWWQSKLILAKDYLSKAFHYLDSKEKQPMLDKLALENKGVTENADQDEALRELRDIVDQVEELGDTARQIVRQNFPNEMSRMEGYGVFNLAYSNNRYDTTLGSEVDRLEEYGYDDLDDDDYPNEALDSDLPKGKHSIATLQKIHGMIVDKMKELAKLYKKKGGEHEYRGHSVIDHLKSLNRKKKQVEDALDKAVANKDRNQQLDPNVDEKAPGYKHDCAAKVVHEKYGKGDCIPEKHTLVKEGNKYVVTHYDVLFESGKTVKDIPVSELDIKTSNEHWHKGYKKKSK